MTESSAFISYHHNDRIIGETVSDALTFLATCGKGRAFIKTFLDVRNIPAGKPWKPIIDRNLATKDWLIAIYTGEQSQFCGYEVGTFSQLHAKSQDKRITTLHDVDGDALPVILKNTQNTLVPGVLKILMMKDVTVLAEEVQTWFHSSVGKFLTEFCSYKSLYKATDEAEDPGRYASNIALAAKRISASFQLARGKDRLAEVFSQIGFRLVIASMGDAEIESIPADAAVFGNTLFFDILGLRLGAPSRDEPSTTWGKLKSKLEPKNGRGVPWMHKIEADVVRAADSRIVSGDDVTFRGENGKVYRPILERHEVFVNGDRHFHLLFVETLDRRFAGSLRSSLLLTALILASRWRFTYFEKWTDTTDRLFGSSVHLTVFVDACKQLFYNIEWIELESAELGTANVMALVDAFGMDQRARIERFFEDWDRAKKELYGKIPALGADVNADNREEARVAVLSFLERTGAQNDEFLNLALQAYAAEVGSHMNTATGYAPPPKPKPKR